MNERIKIVTDSTADLPQEIVERYDIEVLPMHIIMDEKDQYDRDVDISRIYDLIRQANERNHLPITYSPRTPEIREHYERIRNQGYTHILAIHISSKLSHLWENAVAASKQVQGVVIDVIDSQYASVALGLLVMRVAEDVSQGLSYGNVLQNIPQYIRSMRFLIKIRTLKLLEISGRLGLLEMYKNHEFNGGGLIITMRGGILVPFEIVTRKKLGRRILHMLKAAYKTGSYVYLAYGGNRGMEKEYSTIINSIRKNYKIVSSFETETGHINLIHIGPDSWAVAFLK